MVLVVANAHCELAAVMLDAGADPNDAARGWTALHQITQVRKPGSGDNDPAPEGSGNLLRQVMSAAGVSTVVEPDILRAGHLGNQRGSIILHFNKSGSIFGDPIIDSAILDRLPQRSVR